MHDGFYIHFNWFLLIIINNLHHMDNSDILEQAFLDDAKVAESEN